MAGAPTSTGNGGSPPTSAREESPMQRDRARTIFERSVEGRRAGTVPETDVPERPLDELIPEALLRERPAELPEVSEPEIVRHYTRISRRNFDLDRGFYPLGSCTMKHNPRLNERVAALPGHARLHPAQDPSRAQGALELMWLLQRSLAEIAGLPHVSLQPSAGSHGELAGLLLTRAYHADRGEERTKVLTPDTAHGTNPATVTMAGYEVVKVASNERGGVDLDDLRAKADDQTACLMLTNPNTLGLFDENIAEITTVVREAGGTLYYDGANLNAIMGRTRPGDMGFDIVHFNLHKTFAQPHGGGGPGAGPIAVSDRIEPFLPVPRVVRDDSGNGAGPHYDLDHDQPKSIGRLRGFQGNFGVFVRSYAYILSLGGDGLAEASETAVLNANYLLARLREGRAGRYAPVAFDRRCMHEFVLSGAPAKKELGIKTQDVAKRLLDYSVHPPTVYFPLLVDEAMMVEPTETEARETLDEFAEALEAILAEAEEDPEIARNAPYVTPVRRLDEVAANRRPVVRERLEPEPPG
jgi:glycine dehydrogenase subunit 2